MSQRKQRPSTSSNLNSDLYHYTPPNPGVPYVEQQKPKGPIYLMIFFLLVFTLALIFRFVLAPIHTDPKDNTQLKSRDKVSSSSLENSSVNPSGSNSPFSPDSEKNLSSLTSGQFIRFREKDISDKSLLDLDDVPAQSALCIDLKTGEVLFAKDSNAQIPPASIAKLITADYALTLFHPEDLIYVDVETLQMVPEDSTMAWIQSGVYSVKNLIEGMLVPSGNDAAYALAVACARHKQGLDVSSESEENETALPASEALKYFADDLRAYLDQLGLEDTLLRDPSGFRSDDYSTARDLAVAATELIQQDWILDITKESVYPSEFPDGFVAEWTNTNLCLNESSAWYDPNIFGLKTGTLPEAANLITLWSRGDHPYLVITLGSKDNDQRYESNALICQALLLQENPHEAQDLNEGD